MTADARSRSQHPPRTITPSARSTRCGTSNRRAGASFAFLWEWAKIVLVAIVLFLVVRTFLVEAFKIPSGSMERTLLVGDFLLVNKLVYGAEVPFTRHATAGDSRSRSAATSIVFEWPRGPDARTT